MPTRSLREQAAGLYSKIRDEQRLPYKISHARQPNVSEPHDDDGVITYGREHIGSFFERAARAVKEFGKK
jgi:hypothetical protein